MATIKKNDNGTYKATVYVGRDSNGTMLRKFATRNSLKECKKAARELESQVESKSLNNLSMMKMSDYMDKWLEINKPLLAPTTVKGYKMYIKLHFKPAFGTMKVNQITDMHIKQYIADKLKGKLSSTTVRKHFFTLSKMFYDALKTKSPCVDIKAPKNAEFTPTIPTEAEFNEIYLAFKKIGIEDEAIILLAGWCGLRRGEIFALKWNDLNEKDGTIRIDEALALEEEGYKFEFKDPKSHNGIRTIAVPDYLIDLLKTIKQSKPKKSDDKKENEVDIQYEIFTQNPHSFTKKYRKTINKEENNLPKIRFHDLRHYHASLLYKNKVPDQYAAGRLGHDIWVLKKIYQHLGLEETKELDQQVKNIFK
jgi:integrase